MATAESPTCVYAPGERSPPTALATWVFSSSAGWPTGTVSGCGCGARRSREPDPEPRRGEIYRPAPGRAGADADPLAPTPGEPLAVAPAVVPLPEPPTAVPDYDDGPEFTSLTDTTERNGSQSTESSVSLLPRRRPGSSGITGVAGAPPERPEHREPPPVPHEDP